MIKRLREWWRLWRWERAHDVYDWKEQDPELKLPPVAHCHVVSRWPLESRIVPNDK